MVGETILILDNAHSKVLSMQSKSLPNVSKSGNQEV